MNVNSYDSFKEIEFFNHQRVSFFFLNISFKLYVLNSNIGPNAMKHSLPAYVTHPLSPLSGLLTSSSSENKFDF